MRRYFFIIIALYVVCESGLSNIYVSAEEAREVVETYFPIVREDAPRESKAGSPEKFSLLGLAEMWLVPVHDSWIVVSTDKRTAAILARIETAEKPDFKLAPPAAQYLISCYEHDIAYVRDSCKDCHINENWKKQPQRMISQTQQVRSYPSSVDPILGNIAWNQYGNKSYYPQCEKVYNKFCPGITTDKSWLCDSAAVGCVAIAVGQIMQYWHWPYASDVPTTIGGSSKEKKFYNWDLMLPYLTNSSSVDEANAVAGFLRDLGYDLDMSYGEISGATDYAARRTFVHFGYDDNTLTHRAKWKTSGWTNILHEEIAAGRPVYYSGCTDGLCLHGHAFVLDGYDTAGLYHVNLGWGGSLNGYYYIDTITPGTSSYSHWQAAIWGIQPASNYCTPLTVTQVEAPKFCISQAGQVTLDGVNISNITEGKVYSNECIKLMNGTFIGNGSYVKLAIKPIPCSSPVIPPNNIQARNNTTSDLEISPPLERDIDIKILDENIIIESTQEVLYMHIYSIDGKMLYMQNGSALSVSSMPNGLYIIKAMDEKGNVCQKKFLLHR